MSRDQRTREYVARQTDAGRTKKEVIRLLKRAIAREIFRLLTTPVRVPDVADLRQALQSKKGAAPLKGRAQGAGLRMSCEPARVRT